MWFIFNQHKENIVKPAHIYKQEKMLGVFIALLEGGILIQASRLSYTSTNTSPMLHLNCCL